MLMHLMTVPALKLFYTEQSEHQNDVANAMYDSLLRQNLLYRETIVLLRFRFSSSVS